MKTTSGIAHEREGPDGMKVAHSLAPWRSAKRPLCVAIGFFDGVHRGHAKVIAGAIQRARACNGDAWVLTFDPHPARILRPECAPRLLTSLPHKLLWLARLGVDGCMVMPFTRALANWSPRDFLEHFLGAAPTLTHVCVGPNWRFGKDRAGTPALLARFARAHGFAVTVIRPAMHAGAAVSSTRLRAALQHGAIEAATAWLGRPFSILGRVVHGNRLGRKLGYPTANIAPTNEVLPPFGIYAVFARIGRHVHAGVLSYGVRPTIHHQAHPPAIVEVHVFDFAGNLYGRAVEIFFVHRLREEKAFPSLDALRAGIAADVRAARRVLAARQRLQIALRAQCGAPANRPGPGTRSLPQ